MCTEKRIQHALQSTGIQCDRKQHEQKKEEAEERVSALFVQRKPRLQCIIQLPKKHAHQDEMHMEEVRLRQMEKAVHEHREAAELKQAERQPPVTGAAASGHDALVACIGIQGRSGAAMLCATYTQLKRSLDRIVYIDDAGAEQDVLHHPERTVQIPVQGEGGAEQLRDGRRMRIVGREPGIVQQCTRLRRRITHGIVQKKRDEINEEKRHHEAKIARQQLRQQIPRCRPLEGREITGQDAETIQRETRIHQHRQRICKQ